MMLGHRLALLGEEQQLDIGHIPVPIVLFHIPRPHHEDLHQCHHREAQKSAFSKGLALAAGFWLECC